MGALLAACESNKEPLSPNLICSVEPDTIHFGPTVLRQQKHREFTITNAGTSNLHLKVGRVAPPYQLVFVDTTAFSLGPGATKRITVTYAPQTATRHETWIDFGNEVCKRLYVTGTGISYDCGVTPPALDYPWTRIGEFRDQTLHVWNSGSEMLQGEVEENCGDFEIIEGLGPYQLTRDETLKVVVRFAPRSPGLLTCAVEFNNPLCPSVQCRGIGTREHTWYVAADGSGDAPTIQAGIDSSFSGDTVQVAPGTYYENIDFLGKNIVLRSQSGPLVTTLDGSGGNDSVVKFHNQETRAAMIIGFTITGGEGTRDFGGPSGGGIRCFDASPTIKGNRIIGNSVSTQIGHGGGIGVGSGSIPVPRPAPLIDGNLIEDNTVVGNGGGISLFHADAIVTNNILRRNRTVVEGDGGGVWALYYDAQVVLSGNEFWENEACDHGGAIDAADMGGSGIVTISRNLLVRNQARGIGVGDSGAGGACCFGLFRDR